MYRSGFHKTDERWSKCDLNEFADWYEQSLFAGDDPDYEEVRSMVEARRHTDETLISTREVQEILQKLPRDKTRASDNLVGEMMHAIASNSAMCADFAELLNNYIQDPTKRENLGQWSEIEVPMLPKKPGASTASEYRGISRIPILKKCIWKFVQERLNIFSSRIKIDLEVP